MLLAAKCGNNYRLLEQEIDKLVTYSADRNSLITIQMVEELVDDSSEGNFFDPIEKFFSGNMKETLSAIKKYFFNNNDIRPLLAAFSARIRTLIQLKALIESKNLKVFYNNISKNDFLSAAKAVFMDPSEKSGFNVFSQNVWYLSKIIPAAMRFSLQQLQALQINLINIMPDISSISAEEQANLLSKTLLSHINDSKMSLNR